MAMISCPECGKEVSDKAVSCPSCGFGIASIKRCAECGEILKPENKTCPKCGCPAGGSSADPAPQVSTAQAPSQAKPV